MFRFITVAATAALLFASQVGAQVPTAEQIEMLRSLSPEDREALLESMGVSGGLADGRDAGMETPNSQSERYANDRAQSRAMTVEADQRLSGDDTVLVDLQFKRDKPPRVESQGPGLPPLTIPGEPAPVLTQSETEQLRSLIELVRSRNPYQLDSEGFLALPGFPPIMLAGLDEDLAKQRLRAVLAFEKLEVELTRLPVRKVGVGGLKPFGYDLFNKSPSTFAPVTDVPVPADYIVGPGDRINVQLFGSQNRNLRLVVARDGRISFPELGPIQVAGRAFERVAADLEKRVSDQMIGVRASVTMGETRSIRVLVMGEANRPGSYTVSGLATITSAIYAAGGVKTIGSLRDIQLKRQGAVVRRLDLYQLLLRGDTSDDANLLPGDVIFIPPVATTVAVDGEVKRPAIYEIKGTTPVDDVIQMAGGLTNEADNTRVALVRVNDQHQRVVVDVPLDAAQGRSELLRRGDVVRVLRLRPTLDRGVVLEGQFFRPGVLAWREGMRLTDAIGSIEELRSNADLNYLLIRREVPPDRRLEVRSADLAAALRDPASAANIELRPRDRIIAFDTESGRDQFIKPLLAELRRQSRIDRPSEVVSIDGRVKARGDYPLEPNMRISDLLRAGGGLQDSAYAAKAELTRYRAGQDMRETELIEVDLAAILRGDASADLHLRPFDFLIVKEIPEWSEQEQVVLSGEVRFPGTYPIKRGETLRSVLSRAGGLTSLAFPEGAAFTRVELREREREQINMLVDRLQGDLAAAALRAAAANQGEASQAIVVGQSLLAQLRSTKPVGRLVLNLDTVVGGRGDNMDVILRNGDQLVIPKQKQEITVIGEVQTTTSHFFREKLSRDDYISMSGGLTRKADRKQIYVVRADGSVVASSGSGWFRRSAQLDMKPGDTIVVPIDTERMPALPLWGAVTQILYNLAIAAAAVNSF